MKIYVQISQPISFNWYEFTTGVDWCSAIRSTCDHGCANGVDRGQCTCRPGYRLSSNNICLGKTEHTNQREKCFVLCSLWIKNCTESRYISKMRILLMTFRWHCGGILRVFVENYAHSFASVFSKPWLMQASGKAQHHSKKKRKRSYSVIWQKPPHRQNTSIQKATWQHKNATKSFDYTTIAVRLRTVSWGNDSHLTGVVKPVNGIPTLPLTTPVCVIEGTIKSSQ